MRVKSIYTGNRRTAPARIRHNGEHWYFTGRTGVAFGFGNDDDFDIGEYEHEMRHEHDWFDFDGNLVEVSK